MFRSCRTGYVSAFRCSRSLKFWNNRLPPHAFHSAAGDYTSSGFSQHVTGLEYGPVILSGEEMFLPVRAAETVREGKRLLRNEIAFQDCRKFSADSRVTFGPEQR